jgi:predicted RNA binding protein YcfA (HicA-like mRNA interferase family)
MPPFGPISRANLIRGLRALGFDGPYPGGRHAYMVRDSRRIAIPNPHQGAIGINLLARILRQANITHEEWEAV